MLDLLKNAIRKYKTRTALQKGLEHFQTTGITTPETYKDFRKMFVLSKGAFNDEMAKKISKKVGKDPTLQAAGILGKPDNATIKKMASKMKKDGFFVFDAKLPEPTINSIHDFALKEPVNYLNAEEGKYSSQKVLFDQNNLISPRYSFSRNSILNSTELQRLIFDDSLLAFAQEYLGCKPILDHLALWWSAPFFGKGKSKAAQMYHFDMDRIKFIKFFFYITDVNPDNGPHCYVKGSHQKLPPSVTRDGRFTDEEIAHIFGAEECIELVGKKGSIMAVDTRGFHKGKELFKDKRLLFQIEFAISMFGQTYEPLDRSRINPEFRGKIEKYAYSQIFKSS